MKKSLRVVCVVSCMLAVAGLSEAADTKAAEKKATTEKSSQEAPAGLTGKVVETMDSGGYTYVQIENAGKKTWIAIPPTKITKGKTMTFIPGSEMQNFKSKTLNRTFDSIIFSGGVVK